MKLNALMDNFGARADVKRVGRGMASGYGKTAGRGHKGQKARSGSRKQATFQGGQMPILRRFPKFGFNNPFAKELQVVNLNRLAKVSAVEFDAKVMFDLGLISNIKVPVKVLAFGTLDKAITVKVNAISAKAKAAIEAAGGKVEIV